jgi:hypothetical protein
MNKKEISEAARTLGRASKGVPRAFSKAERARRKKRLAEARRLRWQKETTEVGHQIQNEI